MRHFRIIWRPEVNGSAAVKQCCARIRPTDDQQECPRSLVDRLDVFLAQELNTPVLDELYPRLWLVARKSGTSIDALHEQKLKGREVVPVENPQLHLVWHRDKFYIKPLPECLLNHDFWTGHLSSHGTNKRSVALGFVRSYAHLIKHRSDFALVHVHHLIPETVTWNAWCQFIQHFRHCEDTQVAKRYHYGQLCLSRLNWAVRLFQPPCAKTIWFYDVPYWSRISAPLIFGFASISLVLSSMQVILSISTDEMTLGAVGLVWTLLLVIPIAVLFWQVSWGFKNRKQVTSI
ncbi:hypothetical protein AO1008_07183 [Aspergillus oryzae 100-8]|uniref:Uncharacterized protein n=1 Tax=Aspergillus oryzae (strain 3.042) TaxID=1160506 RepID=I8A7K4_ASPO3|nr:hypothetical protein Ao3042_02968 [Aspergillus oryzae 3.042]KDE80915.1 hypothetical protein AO1008_07183 [Aspergillus oryzae 100-8]|eukprot:EIT80749.1 hypothetical protein Ao3042_02968 [Aspergillus oryzae 3.042]